MHRLQIMLSCDKQFEQVGFHKHSWTAERAYEVLIFESA